MFAALHFVIVERLSNLATINIGNLIIVTELLRMFAVCLSSVEIVLSDVMHFWLFMFGLAFSPLDVRIVVAMTTEINPSLPVHPSRL